MPRQSQCPVVWLFFGRFSASQHYNITYPNPKMLLRITHMAHIISFQTKDEEMFKPLQYICLKFWSIAWCREHQAVYSFHWQIIVARFYQFLQER